MPARPQVQPRHAEPVRACARLEHATPPRATPARTLWLTLYAPFGRLQESSYSFYGTICSAETLSSIGLTSSVQQKVDSNVSGLSASGRMAYDALRLLWRAPRNRERSIPAQCSLVAALCCSEVPYHTVGPAQRSAVAKASRFVHVSHQKRDFRAISAQNRRRSGLVFLQVLAIRSSPRADLRLI